MRSALAPVGLAVTMVIAACGGSSDVSDDVQITVRVNADGGAGSFTATGDSICSAGEFMPVEFEFVENGATFRDRYECADGSGTFFIVGEVDVTGDSTSYTGAWDVEEGSASGDYQDIEGSGTLTGETEPEWVVEYQGRFSAS